MNNLHEAVKQYEETVRNLAEKAKEQERDQVNINPDCYVARELMYQTAILKNIESLLRQQMKSGMN